MKSIDEQIRQAIEAGKFNDLLGRGKPLYLKDNPFADPEMRLAYHILHTAGFSLPWIETRREIEAALDDARSACKRSLKLRKEMQASGSLSREVEREWQRACQIFHERVHEINQRIQSYNLEVPNPVFQRMLINAQREIEALTQEMD